MSRAITLVSALSLLLPLSLVTPAPVAAQARDTTHHPRVELLVTTGRFMPTGAQRDAVVSGDHTAAQLSLHARSHLALHTTLGWTRSHAVQAGMRAADAPRLDVVMLDAGAEWRGSRALSPRFSLNPFAGAGAGVRHYTGRTLAAHRRYDPAAYVSAGAEVGTTRVRLRVDVRDYVSASSRLSPGVRHTHHDVLVLAGLRLIRR